MSPRRLRQLLAPLAVALAVPAAMWQLSPLIGVMSVPASLAIVFVAFTVALDAEHNAERGARAERYLRAVHGLDRNDDSAEPQAPAGEREAA